MKKTVINTPIEEQKICGILYANTTEIAKRIGWDEKKRQEAKKMLDEIATLKVIRLVDEKGKTECWGVSFI